VDDLDRRFDELQRNLGVARNILQARLERLIEHGVVRKEAYQEHPVRYEYRLTAKGTDLWPVMISLLQWGDRHAIDGARPVIVEHRGCGGELDDRRRCVRCGADVSVYEARAIRTGARPPRAEPVASAEPDEPGAPLTQQESMERPVPA
jgi:DNA-binding HxlR family transcriptional regulator